ncbi:hypothetical protein [Patiriisocius sp. Uisw_017]|uniref:hypothetical protein n=1 Tax=Patiriisocius sp. Uisw_017 TaxID=3230968 RepID=UPI0039EB6D5B
MSKFFLLLFLSSFVFSCSKKSEKKPEELILGIYVQDQENDYQDVILIGKIQADTIKKITDWDEENKDYVQNRLPYLKKYRNFYSDNNQITEVFSFDTIRKKEFLCSELTVGHSDKYNLRIENEFTVCANFKGSKNFFEEQVLDLEKSSYSVIENKLRKAIEDNDVNVASGVNNNYSKNKSNINIEVLQSIDLNADGIKEYIIKGTINSAYSKKSVILIFNVTKDYIKDVGKIDAWEYGYNLIGVTDLNENGKLELIFQGVGYESIGFEIYEITENGFKQLLYTVPYGC